MASTEGSVKPTEASGGFVCAWPEEKLGDFPLFLLLKCFSAHANPSRDAIFGLLHKHSQSAKILRAHCTAQQRNCFDKGCPMPAVCTTLLFTLMTLWVSPVKQRHRWSLLFKACPTKTFLLQIPFSGTRGSGLPSENGKCMSSHSNPGATLQIPACPGVPPWGRTELDVFRGLFRTIIRYGRVEATERIFRNAAFWWMNDCCSGDKLLMWTNSQGASRIRLLSWYLHVLNGAWWATNRRLGIPTSCEKYQPVCFQYYSTL